MATADRHALNFNPDLQRLLGITDRLVVARTKLANPVAVQIRSDIVFAWEHDAQLYLKRVYETSAQMTHIAGQLIAICLNEDSMNCK